MKKSIPLMTNITHKILLIRFIKLWKHPCWIIGIEPQRLPHTTEKVWKNSPRVQRAGRGIGKVLQRYLFTLPTDDEKLQYMLITYKVLLPLPSQMTAFVKLWRYPCPTDGPNYFTASEGLP
jgi:hypothetical protein